MTKYTSPNPTYGVDQYGVSGGTIKVTDNTMYWQAPSDIYFYGDYTVILWIKTIDCFSNSRVFDFGAGPLADNIILAYLSNSGICTMYSQVYTASNLLLNLGTSVPITLGQWTHFAITVCGNTMTVYYDNNQPSLSATFTVRPVLRNSAFFGKSNWNDPSPNSEFDEIRFYNRCLTQDEIANDKANVKSLIYNIMF